MSSNNKMQLTIKYFGNTDIGLVRTENQDSLGKYPENDLDLHALKGQLFIVADGMGGHTGGKLASSLAVETVIDAYSNSTGNNLADVLKHSIETANERIFKKAAGSTEYNRMGTTFVSLLLKDNEGIIGHVGDSRIYKIENNSITQLTEDHTKVNEMLREGILTPQEAENYPNKSVLARALGVTEKVKVDIIKDIVLKPGQIFILCTDGLAKVSSEEILNIISGNSIDNAGNKLINLANERGGKDNVTVQIISVTEGERKLPKEDEQKTVPVSKPFVEKKKSSKKIIYIILLLCVFAAGFLLKDFLFDVSKSGKNSQTDSTSIIQMPVDPEISNLSEDTSELLKLADKTFKNGKIENALIIYQKILSNEPMHLAALQGVNHVADSFLHEAEEFRSKKNFVEALRLYYRVSELQPENEKIYNLIKICEHQVMYGTIPVETNIQHEPQQHIPKETVQIITITKFIAGDWNFSGLDQKQYEMSNTGIAFASTSIDKIISLSQKLSDIVISADIRLFSAPDESRIGIVLNKKGDSYLLFCIKNKNSASLIKVTDGNEEEISSFSVSQASGNVFKLKVQCSESNIKLFENDSQIGSWSSPDKLTGEAGFYSGKYVSARISNVLISGKKK